MAEIDRRLEQVARDVADHRSTSGEDAAAAIALLMQTVPDLRAIFERLAIDLAAWLRLARRGGDPFASRRVATRCRSNR